MGYPGPERQSRMTARQGWMFALALLGLILVVAVPILWAGLYATTP